MFTRRAILLQNVARLWYSPFILWNYQTAPLTPHSLGRCTILAHLGIMGRSCTANTAPQRQRGLKENFKQLSFVLLHPQWLVTIYYIPNRFQMPWPGLLYDRTLHAVRWVLYLKWAKPRCHHYQATESATFRMSFNNSLGRPSNVNLAADSRWSCSNGRHYPWKARVLCHLQLGLGRVPSHTMQTYQTCSCCWLPFSFTSCHWLLPWYVYSEYNKSMLMM